MTRTTVSATRPDKTGAGEWIDIHSRTGRLMSTLMADGQPFSIDVTPDGMTTVTVEDKKNTLGSGQLTLVFDQARKALQQWIVTDGKGRKTTVSLENLQAGIEPDPQLFVVKIKRDSKNGP